MHPVTTLLRVHGRAFLCWWSRELQELWLDAIERIVPRKCVRTSVSLTSEGGRISQASRQHNLATMDFQRDAMGCLPVTTEAFWSKTAVRGARARVVLSESSVLYRELTLPAAAERELARVLELQLERNLPLAREQMYIDWRIVRRSPERSKIVVRIAAVLRTEIDQIREALQAWNLPVVSIGTSMSAAGDFEFLPRRVSRAMVALGPFERYLSLSAAVIAAAYLLCVGAQWWYERSKVAPQVAAAHSVATLIEQAQADLARASQPLTELRQQMQRPSTSGILAGITSACPADTWIQSLKIQNRDGAPIDITLVAVTPAATLLLNQFQKLQELQNVKIVSSISAGLGTSKDRVEITAQWNASPATVQLSATASIS